MGLPVFPGALVMPAHERHNQAAAQPKLESKIAAKAWQATRIGELRTALAADGLVILDDQARALGLSRSTAWAVLKANHKASGLAAATINRMLSSPELPPRVRAAILTYVEEKLAGLYGHNEEQLGRFAAGVRSVQSRSLARQIPTERLH
jgi:predicted DNA-binding transcriptional regulator AlpA